MPMNKIDTASHLHRPLFFLLPPRSSSPSSHPPVALNQDPPHSDSRPSCLHKAAMQSTQAFQIRRSRTTRPWQLVRPAKRCKCPRSRLLPLLGVRSLHMQPRVPASVVRHTSTTLLPNALCRCMPRRYILATKLESGHSIRRKGGHSSPTSFPRHAPIHKQRSLYLFVLFRGKDGERRHV
jgi:hypothetical protein